MSLPPLAPPPRRRRRWIFLGGFLLGSAVILALLLAPPVQGWLLRRFIATQPGWRLDFERIGVGPTGVDARGLEFTMPGLAASTAPLAIRVAPTRLFSKRELRVEQIEARKIRLTLTPADLASGTAPSKDTPAAPFDGVLRLLQAPLPWALDTAQLDGEIVVRDAGESRLTGGFSLRGGGLSAATPGEFSYELSADSMILPPGPDHKFTSTGTVRVTQTGTHGVARLTLDGDLHLPRYGALTLPTGRLNAEVVATPAGETYTGSLALGTSVRLDFNAALDTAHSMLTGKASLHADQSVAASLLGERLPRATVDGTVSFALNLRNGDLDASLAGDLDARDWRKILPQLAALDALKGRLSAALSRRGDRLLVNSLNATLHGEHSAAEASLVLVQPFDPRKPPASPVATIDLAHWPLEWANPFLSASGVQLAPGEFSAAWTLAFDGTPALRLASVRPTTLGPIALHGEKLPPLPAVTVAFSPVVEISPARATLTIDDLTLTTPAGDRIDVHISASREASTGAVHTEGNFRASTPTLLAGTGEPLPFLLSARWAAVLNGSNLDANALEFVARPALDAPPFLALTLEHPFRFDLKKQTASAPGNDPAADWLSLHVAGFPLAWLSHWLPGQIVTGTFASGESALRSAPDGGFTLQTRAPWRFENLSVAASGQPSFPVGLQLAPAITVHSGHLSVALDQLLLTDPNSDRVSGRAGIDLTLADKIFSADLALEADLPTLPHSAETFGAVQADLRGKFHSMSSRIIGADAFALHVRNAAGELAALEAPAPFIFGLSNTDMIVVSTLAPLHLKLGGFPLAWTRPWSNAIELGGTVAPAEFLLSSAVNRYALRAAAPVKLENFSARLGDRELAHHASIEFSPGVDLTFICMTAPKFELAYTGTAHLTEARVDLSGQRALDLDVALGFKGNEKLLLPDELDLTSRADFAVLSSLPALGLPAHGTLVTRIDGDLLGAQPVELWTRLSGLPGAEANTTLPPLELTLRGRISKDDVLTGGVEVLLAAEPQPTDVNFDVKFNLIEGGLKITSGLHSRFLDGAALLALARAVTPAATPAHVKVAEGPKATVPSARQASASDAALPFWGPLSGSFDLDLGAVQLAPYRIDHVRGRLDATDTELSLHDLGGEMFAGRWGGGLRIEHSRGDTTGEHRLAGEFHIEQFESARVVQTVFPNQLASVDARINVHAKVASSGNSFVSLIDHSVADFSVDGANGVVRLTVPKAELVSTAAVFGGTVLLSPELRALGRLLKKFAEMPIEQIRITGRRAAGGEVTVDEIRFESPQARLLGRGRIVTEGKEPLMNRPLELSLELAAKDELAVILGGMSLLEKKPRADGFRPMRQPFALGGRAGAPDTAPLYDLLAKAVSGSSGTWGFLMRKVQAEVEKKKTPVAKTSP